jgi:hypothetical protein
MTTDPKTKLTTTTALTPPAELEQQLEEDAGRGVSDRFEDSLLPLIGTLQTMSPQCDKHDAAYVEGAEPGLFYLRDSITPIRKTLEVLPIGQRRSWIEWAAGRGGFVARFAEPPSDAEKTLVNGRVTYARPGSNNPIEDTREIFVVLDDTLYMFPCRSTFHTFARNWQSYLRQLKNPRTGKTLPSYAKKYRLSTVLKQNPKGRWFFPVFADLGWASLAEFNAARELNRFVESNMPALLPGGTRSSDAA